MAYKLYEDESDLSDLYKDLKLDEDSSYLNDLSILRSDPGMLPGYAEAQRDFGYSLPMSDSSNLFAPVAMPGRGAIDDDVELAKSNFLRSEKSGYATDAFDKRDLSRAGDTMTALFRKNYGYTPSAGELIQYANLNGMRSAHQLGVNRVINSPSLDSLHQIDVSPGQFKDYWAGNANFVQKRREAAQSDPLTNGYLWRTTQAEKDADPNYVRADEARKLRIMQDAQRAMRVSLTNSLDEPSRFSQSYDDMRTVWDDLKAHTRKRNDEIILSEGDSVLGKIAKYNSYPRELGFNLIDAGLGLGKLTASTYDSAMNGTLQNDVKDAIGGTIKRIGEGYVTPDTVRLAVKYGDKKFMIGNDGVGLQYKSRKANGLLDQVSRFTYGWGDSAPKFDNVLEKNLPAIPIPLPQSVSVLGQPVKLEVVPGLRQNLSGDSMMTPSSNFELSSKAFPGFGVSLELRKRKQ
ncbi:hypothetical protein [Undibacterium umbellatum]|uniref:Uncharacterized protein n=1 Tax=Undibacterium umbellatum TaxID=2762300 RepID=A0ABR6ZGI5_9BURK|nr:hypothetical protein [Undibacterium umbellatum]MBC3910838.1 hypothetical protein [Undibacterium umbellatum]